MDEKDTAGKPVRCKAAVAREPGKPLVIEEIIVAPPSPHEVRIKIICTSLCHTDVYFWQLPVLRDNFPRILGHEAVGIVESVGEFVGEVMEGDMVIPTFISECKECVDCKSEESNLCSKIPFKISPWMPRYDTSRFTDINGQALYHMLYVSSFAEYTVVDVANICKIDPSFPPKCACLLGCGVSTGIGAAWKTANVKAGSTVAIFGLGSVGLAVAEGARLCGAARIIGVDINPKKIEVGKFFGVTDFICAENSDQNKPVWQVIKEMTSGGADYCFECVGLSSLVHEAYASCRKGWGKVVVMGLDKPGAEIRLDSLDVLLDKKSLTGCIYGGLKIKTDVPTLVKRYMDKELHLDEFVTHEIEFKDINKAFDLLIGGECLRCVIWMDKCVPSSSSPHGNSTKDSLDSTYGERSGGVMASSSFLNSSM